MGMAYHHPRLIGKQNSHLLNTTTDAYSACLQLAEQGVDVLSIQIGGTRPVIQVLRHPRLKGEVFQMNNQGRRRFTMLKDCRIEWEDK